MCLVDDNNAMKYLPLILLLSFPAKAENIDSMLFVMVIACESSWMEHKKGDGGTSFGLPQFKKSTFKMISRKAMDDPLFVKAFRKIEKRIKVPVFKFPSHKMMVAQWGMSNGYGHHWTCYKELK